MSGDGIYVRHNCPICKGKFYSENEVEVIKKAGRIIGYNMRVTEDVPEEVFVADVMWTIKNYIYDGIAIKKLCRLLYEAFGLAEEYCCDVIQKVKNDFCMYSPDMSHLCFVDKEAEQQIKGIQ